jgi:1-acyl-sn-glycerol-3-phosphate acyltransferase
MRKLFRIIFRIIPRILYEYFEWILPFARHRERYPLALRFYKAQKLIRYVFYGLGMKIIETNLDEVYKSDKRFFATCNHQSDADPLLMIALAKRPVSFVAKIEIRHMPFVGKVFYDIDGVFIDRSDVKSQIRILKEVEEDLQNNVHDWIIYPEGTRNRDPFNPQKVLGEFHAGTFKIAFKAEAPMLNYAVFGTYRAMHFVKFLKMNLPVQISLINKLEYEQFKDKTTAELCADVYEKTEIAVKDLIKKDADLMHEIGYKKVQ